MQSLFDDIPKVSSASMLSPVLSGLDERTLMQPFPARVRQRGLSAAELDDYRLEHASLEPDWGSLHCCGCLVLMNKQPLIPVVAIPGKEASGERYHGKSLSSAIDFLSVRRSMHSSRERAKAQKTLVFLAFSMNVERLRL